MTLAMQRARAMRWIASSRTKTVGSATDARHFWPVYMMEEKSESDDVRAPKVRRGTFVHVRLPGDAPDTLNSKLEINAEGHILANGQRIQ